MDKKLTLKGHNETFQDGINVLYGECCCFTITYFYKIHSTTHLKKVKFINGIILYNTEFEKTNCNRRKVIGHKIYA